MKTRKGLKRVFLLTPLLHLGLIKSCEISVVVVVGVFLFCFVCVGGVGGWQVCVCG